MQSESSIVNLAKKVVREHPEMFEALMEFERTKRVPKTTYKRRLDITVDETVLRRFKGYCAEHGMSVSGLIERLMVRALSQKKREKKESI